LYIVKNKCGIISQGDFVRKRIILITIIALVAIDQISKFLIRTNMDLHQEIPIINGFFKLYYIQNDGAAFSLLSGKTWLFYIVSILGLIAIFYFFKNSKTKLSLLASSLLCSGLLGNFIDRLIFKKVTDFLSFKFGSYEFAIFNIADICICAAVGLFIIDIVIDMKNSYDKKNKKSEVL
jgi:signal peptidase II